VVALATGVTMALARPEPSQPARTGTTTATTVPMPTTVPPRVAGASATPAGEAEDTPPGTGRGEAAAETRAPRRPERPGNRAAHTKVDRPMAHDAKHLPPASVTPGSPQRTSDEVLRGALPSRSGEGYPESP